jgi:hypothetical protein
MFRTKWRKQLYKVADMVFEILCGIVNAWDISQCEPLVVEIVFPFLKHRPWQLRNNPKLLAVARKLCMLWKEDPASARDLLRKIWTPCCKCWCGSCYRRPHTLDCFHIYEPQDKYGFVWRKKGDKKRFRVGRNGDNLITHFQCNLCALRNAQRRDPVENKPTNDLMMACI